MVWYFSQSAGLKLKFWTTSWKVEKMDKCVAFPVVSPTFCSMSKYVWNELEPSFLQIPSLCAALYTELRPWIPIEWTVVFGTFQIRLKRICQFKRKNWEEQLLNETHLPCSQLLSDIYWKNVFPNPIPSQSHPPKSKTDLNFLHKLESSS